MVLHNFRQQTIIGCDVSNFILFTSLSQLIVEGGEFPIIYNKYFIDWRLFINPNINVLCQDHRNCLYHYLLNIKYLKSKPLCMHMPYLFDMVK